MGYSVEIIRKLEARFESARLHRPMRVEHYEVGSELVYEAESVTSGKSGQVRVVIEKFVGGGFAGQVYRVRIVAIEGGPIDGLRVDGIYAIKILIPPSRFSLLFRNFIYWAGFQGPFQLQVNPAAAKSGALWQKFIRRAAKIRFGEEEAVVDIYATFVDKTLGACGEFSEWVEGRTWRLEVDENIDTLKRWKKGKKVDGERLGSPEYRAKHEFMHEFVRLLHDMGGHEFARQYEWSTCKSQPNCLKRKDTQDDPSGGLTAVDFRAGLALLPFLPMSPGDFKLIGKGLCRGSLVQFDRGCTAKLEEFVNSHSDEFADMYLMLEELKRCEETYRNSVPDITHNHVRLLYSGKLWSTMLDSAVTGWKVRNIVGAESGEKIGSCRILTLLFWLMGLVPFLGKFCRKLWARADWRKHYVSMVTSYDYLKRSIRGRVVEKVISWYRGGRVGAEQAIKLAEKPWKFFCQVPLSLVFAGLHRFIADTEFRNAKLAFIFVRPVKLYFNPHLREQWLRDMVSEGRKKHILSDEDAEVILSQSGERYIQRYLVSLVVHFMTVPVTQIVSVLHMWIWNVNHPEATGAERTAISLAILGIYQIIPVSPGSFCRGLYTTCLAIYDRNFKDYNIALFLSYFKYIGYLAFPIQMSYHYPAMSRFMAAHWATEAVHIVPVFGERGALLEHGVFSLFYNLALTIRRRMRKRAEFRATLEPRYWHVGFYAAAGIFVFILTDLFCLARFSQLCGLRDIWVVAAIVPIVCGVRITCGAGGAVIWKRFVSATVCGVIIGVGYTLFSAIMVASSRTADYSIIVEGVWRVFVFSILCTIGAVVTELKLGEPKSNMDD